MGLAGRLPARPEDLHGPEQGVIVLPRHLAWPGMREFDVTDDRLRRSLYGIVLTPDAVAKGDIHHWRR